MSAASLGSAEAVDRRSALPSMAELDRTRCLLTEFELYQNRHPPLEPRGAVLGYPEFPGGEMIARINRKGIDRRAPSGVKGEPLPLISMSMSISISISIYTTISFSIYLF